MDFNETKTEIFTTGDDTRLLTRIWLPEKKLKAVFLAVHGGMAHGGDWCTPAEYFLEKGIATYAPDLRWHGTFPEYNGGKKVIFHIDSYDQYADDVQGLIHWIKEKHPGIPVFVLSHSNGALISLYYALTIGKDEDIKGFIMSSPWLENKVKVSSIVMKMLGVLSKIAPKLPVTPDSLTDKLTHDEEITKRHHRDEELGLRGQKATVKLGYESIKTQSYVLDHIREWKQFPLFAVIAGQDALAVPETSIEALNSIDGNLTTITLCEDNFHENFNETNREEIYGKIWNWVKPLI